VGDRLDTDLQGARTAGLPGLLVLTGVTGVAELLAAEPHERPVFVSHDLRGLGDVHPAAETVQCSRGVVAACRAAEVEVESGTLVVRTSEAGPDGLDVLRAAAAAVWAVRERGREVDLPGAVAELAGLVEQPIEHAAVDEVPGRVAPGL